MTNKRRRISSRQNWRMNRKNRIKRRRREYMNVVEESRRIRKKKT